MKILKYTLLPIKILLVLIIFAAFIFYRTVIFHSNVTEPVDYVQSVVEEKFKITIPVYKPEPRLGRYIAKTEVDAVATNIDSSGEDNDINTQDKRIPSTSDVAEIETSGTTENKNIKANTEASDSLDSQDSEQLITGAAVSNSISDQHNIDIINELTEKLDEINRKVDQIFAQNRADMIIPDLDNINTTDVINSNGEKVQETDTDIPAASTQRTIHLARQSFWSGDAEKAESFYLDLSKYEDADPDIYGELGNVYYAQGKWKQAGEAYYEAAIRLLDLKHKEQAGYLLRIIQGLDEESANKLRQKISG